MHTLNKKWKLFKEEAWAHFESLKHTTDDLLIRVVEVIREGVAPTQPGVNSTGKVIGWSLTLTDGYL